jgi:hypothetical protein
MPVFSSIQLKSDSIGCLIRLTATRRLSVLVGCRERLLPFPPFDRSDQIQRLSLSKPLFQGTIAIGLIPTEDSACNTKC